MKILLVFLCLLYKSKAITYDAKQVGSYIESTLSCLESFPMLNENATFIVSWSYGYLALFNTTKGIPPEIVNVQERLLKLISTGLVNFCSSTTRNIWVSNYWATLGDFSFKRNTLTKVKKLHKTLSEVLNNSIVTPEVQECYNDVLLNNSPSIDPRYCQLKCLEQMLDQNYNSIYSPEARAFYFGYVLVNNCTNLASKDYRNQATYFCSYNRREIDVMLKYKRYKQFCDTYYYFLNKIAYCSAWGIPEFLTLDIISVVISKIKSNGCVGKDEDSQALTAQTLTVLINMQRMLFQEEIKKQKLAIVY